MKRSKFVFANPMYLAIFVVGILFMAVSVFIQKTASQDSLWQFLAIMLHHGSTAIVGIFTIYGLFNALGHLVTLRIDHMWVSRTYLVAIVCAGVANLGLMHNFMELKGFHSVESIFCLILGAVGLFMGFCLGPFLHGAIVEEDPRPK